MADNRSLTAAAKAKKDEFYTQLTDIEHEVHWYRDHFIGKTILCNCDDPFESKFFFHFAMLFNSYKLKKLIAISYVGSPIAYDLFAPVDDTKLAYKVEINEIIRDENETFGLDNLKAMMNELKAALGNESSATVGKNTLTILKDDVNYCAGDFRSADSIKCLIESDIVITNPPFSLFREYVNQLMIYGKKFLIIGNINCITYKEIFPLFMKNQMWMGISIHSGDREFRVPEHYPLNAAGFRVDDNGVKYLRIKGVRWFTNLEHSQRNRPYDLVFSYERDPSRYPKYDNYDAIEVSKTGDIPYDYFGVMGVPITFIDKYCPEQFKILGHTSSNDLSPAVEALRTDSEHRNRGRIGGKEKYDRILIRRRDR